MNPSEEKGPSPAEAVEDLRVHHLVELADRPLSLGAVQRAREPLAGHRPEVLQPVDRRRGRGHAARAATGQRGRPGTMMAAWR